MTETTTTFGFKHTLALSFAEAVDRVTAALKTQGFGVLTTIDVQATLKQKLDVDSDRYVILGACNPPLAHRALQTDPDIGLMLPCNVIVYETAEGCTVNIANPEAMLAVVDNPELAAVAADARARLAQVAAALGE